MKASLHAAVGCYTYLAPLLLKRLRAVRTSILHSRAFLLEPTRVVGNRPFHLTHNSRTLFISHSRRQFGITTIGYFATPEKRTVVGAARSVFRPYPLLSEQR